MADIRKQLADYLATQPLGEQAAFASRAGLDRSTVSRFLSGNLTGNGQRVSRLIAGELARELCSAWLMNGSGRPHWIVVTDQGLRVAKRPWSRDAILKQFPGAPVLTVVLGPEPGDLVVSGPSGTLFATN